jgi:hypothetical protein
MTTKRDISREKTAFGIDMDKLKININNESFSIFTQSIDDNDYVLKIDSDNITTIEELTEITLRYMLTVGESKIYYPEDDEFIIY